MSAVGRSVVVVAAAAAAAETAGAVAAIGGIVFGQSIAERVTGRKSVRHLHFMAKNLVTRTVAGNLVMSQRRH